MKAIAKASASLVLLLPSLCSIVLAQQGQPVGGYKLVRTITIPEGLRGNDISWVDSATARYYLADRGFAGSTPPVLPKIDVFDTENDVFLTSIPLTSGSNGIVTVPRSHEVWVGLNDSTVDVINTDTNLLTHVISTGGKARADEVAYDPADHLILIANDRDTPPFVSFISTRSYSVVKTLNYDGLSAPQSTGGIEQPVWDDTAGKFYISIPSTKTNVNGEVDELDPHSLSVTRSFPSACKGPAGLVLVPGERLVTSCGDVIDIASGNVLTTVKSVGGDQIWYNSGDQRVYFGGGTDGISVNVIDAITYAPLTTLVVGNRVASPGVSQTTHGVTADAANNQIFVPVTGLGEAVGVQVWRNGTSFSARPNPVPGTGTGARAATLSWNAPNADVIEVRVGSPTGVLFTHNINAGSMSTGPWITDGMMFYLQDVTGGKPLTSDNTLATLIVHVQ